MGQDYLDQRLQLSPPQGVDQFDFSGIYGHEAGIET